MLALTTGVKRLILIIINNAFYTQSYSPFSISIPRKSYPPLVINLNYSVYDLENINKYGRNLCIYVVKQIVIVTDAQF